MPVEIDKGHIVCSNIVTYHMYNPNPTINIIGRSGVLMSYTNA